MSEHTPPNIGDTNGWNGKKRLIGLLKEAGQIHICQGDPGSVHGLEKIPAERIVRHLYHPRLALGQPLETNVKIEKTPLPTAFPHKKRAQHASSATNHHFQSQTTRE